MVSIKSGTELYKPPVPPTTQNIIIRIFNLQSLTPSNTITTNLPHFATTNIKMQFTQLTIAAFASVLSLGYALPTSNELADLADGLYSITKFDNGTFSGPVLVATDASVKRSESSESSLEARYLPNPSIGCSNRGINGGDFSGARNSLNAWCNNGNVMNANSYYWWTSNSAQAYICNYSGNQQGCNSGEYNDANSLIDTSCGGGQAGWVRINDVSLCSRRLPLNEKILTIY